MLIERELSEYLHAWKESPSQLPLILRGARQVGKTTLIHEFGKSYDQYLYFNLEKAEDAQLLNNWKDIHAVVQLIFLARGILHRQELSSLIFFDEVQEKPEVLEALRYFKEEYPHLDVIATGSLLEFGLSRLQRVPVGRIEYAELHPFSFKEYLLGMGQEAAIEYMSQIPIQSHLLPVLYSLFHEYALIGGMPGIASAYLIEKDLSRVRHLYAGIIESYKDDVDKYASNESQRRIIRHIMDTAPYEIDNRIVLNHFGASSFKTREIREAIDALAKARILSLVYPTTQTQPPIVPNFKKRPRLHFLDIGLVNYQLGLHRELLTITDLHNSSKGKFVQQIVNQELKAKTILPDFKQTFWVREERGSSAEVDIVYPYQQKLIPIEVKSGARGSLRSLHEFMDLCPHAFAVRVYGGDLRVDQLKTRRGKTFRLLNLPYFLSGQIENYLDWFLD